MPSESLTFTDSFPFFLFLPLLFSPSLLSPPSPLNLSVSLFLSLSVSVSLSNHLRTLSVIFTLKDPQPKKS